MNDVYGRIKPQGIRLDASTVCQLRCVSCPTSQGEIAKKIGAGFLKFNDFRELVDSNPWIKYIELSNWGEIFLNPELLDIIKYAYQKKIMLHAGNGANLNTMSDEMLEALVKYRFGSITCSIDGAGNETYRIYRIRGDIDKVLSNIKKINEHKAKYNSRLPHLTWSFVAFGHNEHEIQKAKKTAGDLHMDFSLVLSWNDMYDHNTFSPVKDRAMIAKETGLGVADRSEYHQKYGVDYIREVCTDMWKLPQINFDGKVLGCCINYGRCYGNAFESGLLESLNGEQMSYARQMLLGRKPPREDIACTTCTLYQRMNKDKKWLSPWEINFNGRYARVRGALQKALTRLKARA